MSTTKKVAVVTGGSRGIGAGIAEKLGALQFHVIVNYVANEAKAIEVVKKIENAGGTAEALRFDVSKEAEVAEAFEKIAKIGTLNVLVNNAGISEDGLILRLKSLAKEIASRNIRVNAITPGYIETDMTQALSEAQRSAITENIPLKTLGSTSDVAELVGFLATDASKYITGQVIGVNGGLYI